MYLSCSTERLFEPRKDFCPWSRTRKELPANWEAPSCHGRCFVYMCLPRLLEQERCCQDHQSTPNLPLKKQEVFPVSPGLATKTSHAKELCAATQKYGVCVKEDHGGDGQYAFFHTACSKQKRPKSSSRLVTESTGNVWKNKGSFFFFSLLLFQLVQNAKVGESSAMPLCGK